MEEEEIEGISKFNLINVTDSVIIGYSLVLRF